jgi:hypothetical protein
VFGSSQIAASPRQQIIDEALIAILRAAKDRSVLSLTHECQRLAANHPNSGMTTQEMRDLIARLAVDRGVSVGFG